MNFHVFPVKSVLYDLDIWVFFGYQNDIVYNNMAAKSFEKDLFPTDSNKSEAISMPSKISAH